MTKRKHRGASIDVVHRTLHAVCPAVGALRPPIDGGMHHCPARCRSGSGDGSHRMPKMPPDHEVACIVAGGAVGGEPRRRPRYSDRFQIPPSTRTTNMTHQSTRRFAAIASLALITAPLLAASPASAHAANPPAIPGDVDLRQLTVNYHDLDLTTARGRARLEQRIDQAAATPPPGRSRLRASVLC
eukprot:gene1537-1560_t